MASGPSPTRARKYLRAAPARPPPPRPSSRAQAARAAPGSAAAPHVHPQQRQQRWRRQQQRQREQRPSVRAGGGTFRFKKKNTRGWQRFVVKGPRQTHCTLRVGNPVKNKPLLDTFKNVHAKWCCDTRRSREKLTPQWWPRAPLESRGGAGGWTRGPWPAHAGPSPRRPRPLRPRPWLRTQTPERPAPCPPPLQP